MLYVNVVGSNGASVSRGALAALAGQCRAPHLYENLAVR
jgi:hypothetical protein